MVWLKRDTVQPGAPRRAPGDENKAFSTEGTGSHSWPDTEPSGDVVGKLRSLVDAGHFPLGSRLPAERALAVQLRVGRPALREAIKALSQIGILQSRRGAGTFVKAHGVHTPQIGTPDGEPAEFRVLEVLEVRKILEPRAAWLAATRATERQLLEIEAARQKLEQHDQDWLMVDQLDYELHAAIIRGAQNPALNRISRFLVAGAGGARSMAGGIVQDPERMRRDHRAIVEAIFKRQADAAELAMTEHLNSMSLDVISEASR